jgi:WD40 repeat protein
LKNFNPNNLKVKKSVILSSPIFAVKYSYFRPNILCACEESGYITIIDTQKDKKIINSNNSFNQQQFSLRRNSIERLNENFNNTLSYHEMEPILKYQAHGNAIFDFEWCFSDNKILTASCEESLLLNYEYGSNITNEILLKGHTKSIKNVKQAFYDENIIASCGRDGIIFIWDLRTNERRFCNKNCDSYKTPHIHPVGAFKSLSKINNQFKRRTGNVITEDTNTFTGINFFSRDLLVSIETNEE